MITLGGTALGLGIILYRLAKWWPGIGAFKKVRPDVFAPLLPTVIGCAFGMLLTMCGGGLVGALTDFVVWGTSGLGDLALVYGVGGQRQDVTRAGAQALTNGGHLMVLLALFVYLGLRSRGRTAGTGLPILAGMGLGLNAGIASYAAVPLASLANFSGAWFSTAVLA